MCVCVDLREKPPAKKEGGGEKGGKTTTTNPEGNKEGTREGPNRLASTGLHVVERVSEHRPSVQ